MTDSDERDDLIPGDGVLATDADGGRSAKRAAKAEAKAVKTEAKAAKTEARAARSVRRAAKAEARAVARAVDAADKAAKKAAKAVVKADARAVRAVYNVERKTAKAEAKVHRAARREARARARVTKLSGVVEASAERTISPAVAAASALLEEVAELMWPGETSATPWVAEPMDGSALEPEPEAASAEPEPEPASELEREEAGREQALDLDTAEPEPEPGPELPLDPEAAEQGPEEAPASAEPEPEPETAAALEAEASAAGPEESPEESPDESLRPEPPLDTEAVEQGPAGSPEDSPEPEPKPEPPLDAEAAEQGPEESREPEAAEREPYEAPEPDRAAQEGAQEPQDALTEPESAGSSDATQERVAELSAGDMPAAFLEPAVGGPRITAPAGALVAASIDVGATSVHLLVGTVDGHRVAPLLDESVFLGLGDRVSAAGFVGDEARATLVADLGRYAAAARELGAASITIVGTEPMRRAADAATVVYEVGKRLGVPLHILDHAEEGLLTLIGATGGSPVSGELLLVDVGGGSSEFVVVRADGAARSVGIPLGAARLTRELVRSDPPLLADIEALRAETARQVANAPVASPTEIVAVGGTASNLLRLLPATALDRSLTRRRIAVALAMLSVERSGEAATRHFIRPERARILPAGAIIIDAVLEKYGADRLHVSEAGIREGAILAAVHGGAAWRDRLAALARGWAGPAFRD